MPIIYGAVLTTFDADLGRCKFSRAAKNKFVNWRQ
jgi:hypothetical protein